MRDYLLDMVQHTLDLGCIELLKITGTTTETGVVAMGTDQSVVIDAAFKNPIPEFVGTVGLPNLAKLKILLNLPEYREDAVLSTTRRKDNNSLESIEFKNKAGDFRNSYRFMNEQVVNEKLKTPKFKGANWHVEFEPTAAAIARLRMQAQANSEETNFQAKTDGTNLKFYFGDPATHAGDFVFHAGITGQLKRAWSWPVTQFLSILSLSGDKFIRISDDGAAQITVDSGLAVYNYILPAQSK
jgi:hypothetical protein